MAAPNAPTAAASVGVATPKRMLPSTEAIKMASGKNEENGQSSKFKSSSNEGLYT